MGRSPSPPRRRSLSPPTQRRPKRKLEDERLPVRPIKRKVETTGTLASHRANTCPFLLRVFLKSGQSTPPAPTEDATPSMSTEEFQVYVWMNVSLREVVDLMKDILVEARDPRARLTLKRKCYRSNKVSEMGVLSSTYRSAVDRRTLRSFGFQIGDVIELTIHQPSGHSRVRSRKDLEANASEESQAEDQPTASEQKPENPPQTKMDLEENLETKDGSPPQEDRPSRQDESTETVVKEAAAEVTQEKDEATREEDEGPKAEPAPTETQEAETQVKESDVTATAC